MYGQIEGTGYKVIHPDFNKYFIVHARVERLWTGARWSEGPAWFAAGRYLVWSDIPNNRMMRWDETDGSVSVFRAPANNSNGNTIDSEGRLISCEHLSRQISRTEHNGKITSLASHINGKRFNSPNDVVVKSDGSIWFTDPSYGIFSHYEGERADSELSACQVYRYDPATQKIDVVASDYVMPNGIAFSPDEQFLYVSDTGVTHQTDGPAHIKRHKVTSDNNLEEGFVFANSTSGLFDGFRVDEVGNVWTSAADGVHCLDVNGQLLGKILIPELVANVCFGGAKLNRLFICATSSLYSVYLNTSGC